MIIPVELTLFGVTCTQLINQELKYHNLTFCFELLKHLTIPHSNASEERIFSYISKCKTPSRSSLHLDGSLSSIMVLKTHISDLLEWKPTKEVLEKAKEATSQYNRMKQLNLKILCIFLLRLHMFIIKIWSGDG